MSGFVFVVLVSIAFLGGWAFGAAMVSIWKKKEAMISKENDAEGIHEDGSVELLQRWYPGGARGNESQLFEDGEQYLFAIRLASDLWDFVTVTAQFDGEHGCNFLDHDGSQLFDWDWSEVEWFAKCEDFDLPTS